MRIAIAPNAFRGSLSAQRAVECIRDGLQRSRLRDAELIGMPLADGGDGTLDTIIDGLGGERSVVTVKNPLGEAVEATYGVLNDGSTAVIELARASGVELIPRAARNPMVTTSWGTGELIRAAVERGVKRIFIGMGGSATVEGGAGCLQALGVRLLDVHGDNIPTGGAGLAHLARIEVAPARELLGETQIVLLSDVTNPLLGKKGAARIFGPQKGADPAMVEQLDANLGIFAEVMQRDLGKDVVALAGAGAAGGFGAGIVGCLDAELSPGGATIIKLLGYDKQLPDVDLIVTGEGKLDAQTVGGKAVQSIAEFAKQIGVPVVALAGMLEADPATLQSIGISAAWSIVPGVCTLDEAIQHAGEWLTSSAEHLGNMLALRVGENAHR
jgi:glycerate kinase